MPLSNPFRRQSDADLRLSLRERAAALRASFRPAPEAAPLTPDSGDAELLALAGAWDAATAAYDRAVQNQIVVSEKAPTLEVPPAREPYDEWQRLIPGWRERTGVNAAEDASREAMDVVNEIEDRIAALPATTMAGLRLKARVAERSDRFEVVWPDGFGEGLVRDILAMGEPEIGADADLIRLGHLFEAAREREAAACKACNEALREAQQHLPQRPAALVFRASDHPLRLRKYLTHPDHLEGEKVTAEDIAWMRRKPYVREIRRPVRPEDNLPASARTVVDSQPWPEAQDRADEIVTAWEAWHAERDAIHNRYVTDALDDAAGEAGEAAAALAERLAAIPAQTAEGFRVKLRALAYYRRGVLDAELVEEPDPDQFLSHSIWRDLQGEAKAVESSGNSLIPAILDGWAAWGAATGNTEDTAVRDRVDAQRDRLLRSAMALPATSDSVAVKALACAWMEWVAVERPGQLRDAYTPADQLAFDIHAAITGREVEKHEKGRTTELPLTALIPTINFAVAGMSELRAIREAADLVASVAAAAAWQGSNRLPEDPSGATHYNQAGQLMAWLADALGFVVSTAEQEARGRRPDTADAQATRLALLAESTVNNGDGAETTAFALDLLALAKR